MGKYGNGAKGGLLGGFAYGIISAIVTDATLVLYKSNVLSLLKTEIGSLPSNPLNLTPEGMFSMMLVVAPIVLIISGLIVGVILGLIFAAVHNSLPSKDYRIKGVIFGIIIWVILDLLLGLYNRGYGAGVYYITLAVEFGASLLYGYILGRLFNRWETRDKAVLEEPPYPNL